MKKLASILAAVLMLGLMIVPVASAATIKAQLPVIFVSAGQSGGVYVTDALCVRAGIPADWSDSQVTIQTILRSSQFRSM